jgi:hypothetical protein
MKLDILGRIEKPYICKIKSQVDTFINSLNELHISNNEFYVKILDGEKMKTKQTLFEEFACQLDFPTYFGYNWDAFDECINDLSWLNANVFILGFINSEKILCDENDVELKIFGSLLSEACDSWALPLDEENDWGRSGKPFHILMQHQDEQQLQKFGIL